MKLKKLYNLELVKYLKLVEEHINSCATGFYPSELSERDIESQLKSFEISVNDKEVIKKLRDLSSVYDFLEFKQELKKLFFFKSFDKKPLSQEEVESVFSQEVSKNERKLFDFLLEKKEELIIDFFSNYPGEIKKGLDLLAKGKKINYEGATGVSFNEFGEAKGSFLELEIKNGKFKAKKQR